MFKKILFPIDFSLYSNTLMGCIPHLKTMGMEEAILLHVIDPTDAAQWANVEEAITSSKKEGEIKMKGIISKTLSAQKGIKAKYMTAVGLPYQVILRIAEEEKVSLIVIGSQGHSFIESAILGSVTNNVIRNTNVPTLITKVQFIEEKGEKKPVCLNMKDLCTKVLCPTDFSDYSMSVLNLIEKFENSKIDEVVVVHIQDTRKLLPHLKHKINEFNKTDSDRLAKIKHQLETAGYKVKTILKEGVPFVEINKIAQEEDITLIMLSSQGKSAIKEVLLGSVSESVARANVRPVMIIPKNWKMLD